MFGLQIFNLNPVFILQHKKHRHYNSNPINKHQISILVHEFDLEQTIFTYSFSGITFDFFCPVDLSCTARALVELEFSSPLASSWNE